MVVGIGIVCEMVGVVRDGTYPLTGGVVHARSREYTLFRSRSRSRSVWSGEGDTVMYLGGDLGGETDDAGTGDTSARGIWTGALGGLGDVDRFGPSGEGDHVGCGGPSFRGMGVGGGLMK